MRFIIEMARREIRASWKRLIFFFLCIAIGVGSVVAIRSIIRNFNRVFTSEARELMGADIQLSTSRPWSADVLQTIEHLPFIQGRAQADESTTMLRPAAGEGALLVELKSVDSSYPLYGKIELEGGKPFGHAMLRNGGVIVARAVLERLHLRKGDLVKMGESTFVIREILEKEPGVGGFRFGPRVLISREELEKSGLSGFGSRIRRKILLKLPEAEVAKRTQQLRTQFKSDLINVRSYKESQEQLDVQFTRAENFLSLTGLVILVLGGIGISSVTRVFIDQKKKSIAVLKCLGAKGSRVISVYLVQVLLLGVAGSIAGIALAQAAVSFIGMNYASLLPSGMSYSLQNYAILQGFAFGILVTILFAALPLLRIRHIKPNVLLREELGSIIASPGLGEGGVRGALKGLLSRMRINPKRVANADWLRRFSAVLVLAGLVLLSTWQAGSLKVGGFFLIGLLVTLGIIHLAARLLIWIVRKMRTLSNWSTRYAISSLSRPGNQTNIILIAVGIGSFFILAILSLKANLLQEMNWDARTNMPNMYLIDIQRDQVPGVTQIIRETIPSSKNESSLIPTVRSRIVAVNKKQVDPESEEYKKDRGRLGFEYTMTYRFDLDPSEKVIAGRFWERSPSSAPEVSIEESLKGMMGLDLGGTVTFDILGRRITARVTSIRRVDWRNARTGFYIIFRPGTLENAPTMYIAAVNAPTTEPARSRFQRILVDRYPNITAIDVHDVVRSLKRVLNQVTIAVSFVAGFVLLSGILILIGSIGMTKFQRVYEAAVLKTLGAKRKVILFITILEYGLLGSVAAIIGALSGAGLSYLVAKYIFEIPWYGTPYIYLLGVLSTGILVVLVGVLGSFDVLSKKPLSILRSQ